MTIKLKITNDKLGPGYGKGVDSDGKYHIVIGGDLCYGTYVNVSKKRDGRYIISPLDYPENEKILEKYDDDALIRLSDLSEVKHISKPYKRVYEFDGFWYFVPDNIRNEVEYLYSNDLTTISRIRVTKKWSSVRSGAAIQMVNYHKLFQEVLEKRKHVSAHYYSEKDKDFDNNVYADLFIRGDNSSKVFQIQLWQIVGEGKNILYSHAMMDSSCINYEHFDLATHHVDKFDIPFFLYEKKRLNAKKTKWLRIDGSFEEKIVFELTKMFFPYDDLIDEFREKKYV